MKISILVFLSLLLMAALVYSQEAAEPTLPMSAVRQMLAEKDAISNQYLIGIQQLGSQLEQAKKDNAAKDAELKKPHEKKCQ